MARNMLMLSMKATRNGDSAGSRLRYFAFLYRKRFTFKETSSTPPTTFCGGCPWTGSSVHLRIPSGRFPVLCDPFDGFRRSFGSGYL
jgi:hypothetical protein